MSVALAIFAKTASLSPVKTRLAVSIGAPLAEAFYALSVESITEVVTAARTQSKKTLIPYWALAEEEAINYPQWQTFQRLWTGDGNLGNRLHNIYSSLRKTHTYVMMIGTDSPQLEPEIITNAIKKLTGQPKSCIIGPCPDGGFYLFAATVPIPKEVWTNVTYSKCTTLQELTKQLEQHEIKVSLLISKGDVDTASNLKPLINALKINNNLLPAQQKLYRWLQSQT